MKKIHYIPITGRPNAGKTTLINFLSHTKRPVGKRAGTTLRITPIPLVLDVSLVDFPGFGRITKRSKSLENIIKDQIVKFLEDPQNSLLFGIHVIDISTFSIVSKNLERKGIIPLDIEMIEFLCEITNIPPIVVLNKIDKLEKDSMEKNRALLYQYNLPKISLHQTSFKTKDGIRSLKSAVKMEIARELGPKYKKWR
jgi:GTP-binding protein EngB required for normal cell division